ncbi:MAG: NUDIX domain-containing protein [archaeon]
MTEKISTVLKDKIRCQILESLMKKELTFSEILEKVNLRDHGQLNYHLGLIIEHDLMIKKDGRYALTKMGEKMAIYTEQFMMNEMYPISVVCVMVKNKEGKLLITKRSKKPYKGHWVFPGGKVRIGESMAEASKREIREETGLEIEVDRVAGMYPTIAYNRDEVSFHANLVAVKARVKNENHKIQLDESMVEYKFIHPSEIGKHEFIPSNEPMIKDIAKNGFSFEEFTVRQ